MPAPQEPLEKRALDELEARGILTGLDAVFTTAQELDHWWYFDSQTQPALVIHLPRDRRAAVMDDSLLLSRTGESFANQRKEFLRNILAGAALYDCVLVYASVWREDVEELMRAVRPEVRTGVILAGSDG